MSFEREITDSLKEQMNYVSDSQLVIEIPTEILKPITKVIVKFNISKVDHLKSFTLRHAFNHVMSDLVLDKEVTDFDLKDDFSFKFSTPKSASHILINAKTVVPLKSLIKSVEVFVADDQSVVTVDDSIHIDNESISYQKPVLTDYNDQYSYLITDGSYKTVWQSDNYPANIDINLEAVYDLKRVLLYFPENQKVIFNLYGSNDGLNYKLIDKYQIEQTSFLPFETALPQTETYSFIRVNVLYNSGFDTVRIKQIRVFGDYLRPQIQQVPFKFLIDKDFDNKKITLQTAIFGIIERRIGKKYCEWFKFQVDPQANRYFQLVNTSDNKIKIIGSSGVDVAAGLNYYLKYYCQVNISQQGMGDRVVMPQAPVRLKHSLKKTTPLKYIYSYNYTTYSYTMAFWDADEWQNELDWLALNGVNLVLDPIGQEAVWSLFLRHLGYSDREIQRQVSFSTYSAWQWMGNISGVGGPVSLDWINGRTRLAHQNHQFMQALDMAPIFRGYGGLLPDDVNRKPSQMDLIPQGQWCSFHRPDMLKTTSQDYVKLAELFYQIQQEVLGKITHFYSVDPFHEGGIMGDMTAEAVSENLLDNLLKADPEAIWVIQSWQENPTPGLLKGIQDKKEHALVLDLYAEKSPQWTKSEAQYHGGKEFSKTPWIFCMLNNFGGRMVLSGHLSDLKDSYKRALNEAKCLQGIGITPEASLNNPLLNDYFFELIWQPDRETDLDTWLENYASRRYGFSDSAVESLKIQLQTVYRSELNNLGQGAPESVINARPNRQIKTASTWGNATIGYSRSDLITALQKLFKDFDILNKSSAYRVDLVTLAMQVLSNQAQVVLKEINRVFDNGDIEGFLDNKVKFMELIELVDEIENEVPVYRLSTWQDQATKVVQSCDDFTKNQAQIDARAVVTTWGSIKQSNSGGLHDYSNRQWSGLTKTLYLKRWNRWFLAETNQLENREINTLDDRDWFNMEWNWVISQNRSEENSGVRFGLKELIQNALDIADDGE